MAPKLELPNAAALVCLLLLSLVAPAEAYDAGDALALLLGTVLTVVGCCACLGWYARKRNGQLWWEEEGEGDSSHRPVVLSPPPHYYYLSDDPDIMHLGGTRFVSRRPTRDVPYKGRREEGGIMRSGKHMDRKHPGSPEPGTVLRLHCWESNTPNTACILYEKDCCGYIHLYSPEGCLHFFFFFFFCAYRAYFWSYHCDSLVCFHVRLRRSIATVWSTIISRSVVADMKWLELSLLLLRFLLL